MESKTCKLLTHFLLFLPFYFFFLLANCCDNKPPVNPSKCSPTEDQSKYGFEETDMGWVAQTLPGNQAITEVIWTDEQAFKGCASLKAMVDLVPGNTNKDDGEAFVDLRSNPPSGVSAPANMAGRKISCQIWAAEGARGPSGARNYVQVFAKDSNFKGYYPFAQDILQEKDWFEVSTMLPTVMDSTTGFDPANVVLVGVKIGARSGATQSFTGFVYIDVYDWK
jgi:hypothetical protein